jgi:hypothetical protein
MQFYRIFNNKVHNIGNVNQLGFSISDPSYIPDEYLKQENFVILRTCFGIGDWGIITAMPRLLKQKYPNCKVYIPSISLLNQLFGPRDLFDDTYSTVLSLFDNNPYVDGRIDDVQNDIFHDHYRIYSDTHVNTPLLEQMLKFWQFTEDELADSQPELYWSLDEIKTGDEIIKLYTNNNEFGSLLISNRFGTQSDKHNEQTLLNDIMKITDILKLNNFPYFYWTYKPINELPFNFINTALDMHNMSLRMQLYIKSKSKINIANQCGTNHLVVRYSDTYEVQRQQTLGLNFVKGIRYL